MLRRKLTKRLLVMALTGLMLTASVPAWADELKPDEMPLNPIYSANGATWNNMGTFVGETKDDTEYSTVYFGSYPQTEVTDTALQGKINSALAKESKTTGDATVEGVKYRKVGKEDANYNAKWGEAVYRYFKWEPIVWRVLQVDTENNKLFVVADQALDCQEYNESNGDVTWEICTMRKWLNGSQDYESDPDKTGFTKDEIFIDAAFSDGKDAIVAASLENKYNPQWSGTSGGNPTEDMAFLLSYDDVIKTDFGFCKTFKQDSTSRAVKATDYASAMGVMGISSTDWYGGNCYWWLRSPGKFSYTAMRIEYDGSGILEGNYVVDNSCGVVPALYLNLSSKLWSVKEIRGRYEYTITFDGNGINLPGNTGKTDKDGKVKFPAVSREGYTLKGWFTEKEGGEQVTENTVFNKSITIYAHWSKNESSSTGGEGGGNDIGGGTDIGGGSDAGKETKKPGEDNGQQTTGPDAVKQTEIITPVKVTIGSAKNNKKGTITIKIKTKDTDAAVDGYEVASATSKKKLSKVKKFKTFTKASFKLKKLKKGKTYYIKIRAFKMDSNNKKVYGAFSKIKKIKVRK